MTEFRSRIVGTDLVAAQNLRANPANWRTHPKRQKEAIRKVLSKVGFVQNVIVNKRTGLIVDGHARVDEALAVSESQPVPVVYIDVDPAEEAMVLATLDPIGAMAGSDTDKLRALCANLDDLPVAVTEDLGSLLVDEDAGQGGLVAEQGIYALREDAQFPSSNEWGIPDLRTDRLSGIVPDKIWVSGQPDDPESHMFLWGTNKFPDNVSGGVLGFYVDDYRFERVWTEAVKTIEDMQSRGWGAAIAPDFSVWRDDPVAVQIYAIYRSRWCARYWQEAGIDIIPSLNWSDENSQKFAFVGLPTEAPLVSCQCRTTKSRKGKEFFLRGISYAIEQLRPQGVLFYGGEEHRAWLESNLPPGPTYHFLDNWARSRDRKRRVK